MLNIIVPTFPKSLKSGTAAIVPNAPPPILFAPRAYASLTISDMFCSIFICPLQIWYTLRITAINISNKLYWKILDDIYPSSFLQAIFIATAKDPIGNTYFIIPNIPPKKSLSIIPI